MTWADNIVHCSHPDPGYPRDWDAEPPENIDLVWGDNPHPTCKGPGPLRREFVNDVGHRDVETIEQCPDCDGHGGSHGEYRLITLESQGLSA